MYSSHSLLLVEDDPDAQFLAIRALSRIAANWDIRTASNGLGAQKEILREPKPSILITDLNMPAMDGYDLIEWIRTRPELSIRIVVFSGCEEFTARQRCLHLGVDQFISKTTNFEFLSYKVGKLMSESTAVVEV